MTGFGQSQGEVFGQSCVIDIKSVNHRFLETKIRLPFDWESNLLEKNINSLIRKQIQRGSLQVTVRIQEGGLQKQEILVNSTLAKEYAKAWLLLQQSVRAVFPFEPASLEKEQVDFDSLFRFVSSQPGVMQGKGAEDKDRWPQLGPLLESAMIQLTSERKREGNELQQEIRKWLLQLMELSQEAEQHSQTVISKYQIRFQDRVQALLQSSSLVEKESIQREMALLVAGWDVTEEFHRLRVHVKECIELCEKLIPVGKQMDFFVQELHREINTLGAKAHSAEISSLVVSMKNILERIREQVQNVE